MEMPIFSGGTNLAIGYAKYLPQQGYYYHEIKKSKHTAYKYLTIIFTISKVSNNTTEWSLIFFHPTSDY